MLVSLMIAQVCAGLTGTQLQACSKAVEAAGLQIGVTQTVNLVEKKTTEMAVHEVTAITGETMWVVTGTALKVYREKSVSYPLRRNPDGVIPSVVPTLGVGQGSLNLGWKF